MRGQLRATALTLASTLLVAGCSSGAEQVVPRGPFDGTTGAQLYAQACSTCHGTDLRGTEQGPPLLNRIYEPGHHSDASFVLAAMNGARAHHWDFGDMPPIEGITQDQVEAIVAFVREEQRAAGIQ